MRKEDISVTGGTPSYGIARFEEFRSSFAGVRLISHLSLFCDSFAEYDRSSNISMRASTSGAMLPVGMTFCNMMQCSTHATLCMTSGSLRWLMVELAYIVDVELERLLF